MIDGGPGRDQLLAGAGTDRFRAKDGERDTMVGGPGPDTATLDRRLDRVRGLEREPGVRPSRP